ncbi:VOC family protein [Allopusillimonas ginsengisoli]|uniref:VOC family protein n=1 Tax=Allopusillimonas ginsengisoli TaxID=453575 RepID=UPI001020FCC6|nr:VOC family protein [Allopusillimonas ginsengisoli]TEA80164.1 VOC family protein [Allopusillimonas ginsengisoli]
MTEHIDHIVINVAQHLDTALDCYRRLGFTLTPRGHHSLGTSNHLAIFGSDYLELMGVEPRNADKASLPFPPGLIGLVFKTTAADALWQRLAARRVPLQGDGPQPLSRPITLEDGTESEARFRTIDVQAASVPNGRLFFCHHLTPELVWRPEWQTHANAVQGIAEYVYVTPSPARTANLLEQAFGPGVLNAEDGGVFFDAGKARVRYLRREAIAQRYGIAADEVPAEDERAVALTLYTRSLDAVRDALRAGAVPGWKETNNRVVVPPTSAMNVILAFQEA